MKKFLLLACSLPLFICSCSTISPLAVERVDVLDYSEYNQNGFFITESNSVSFAYSPVGSIAVSLYAGEGGKWNYIDGVMHRDSGIPHPSKGLKLAVAAAKQKGANAIINLKISPSTINVTGVPQSGFVLSGMAIKME